MGLITSDMAGTVTKICGADKEEVCYVVEGIWKMFYDTQPFFYFA